LFLKHIFPLKNLVAPSRAVGRAEIETAAPAGLSKKTHEAKNINKFVVSDFLRVFPYIREHFAIE
jgi:hypothetical protein